MRQLGALHYTRLAEAEQFLGADPQAVRKHVESAARCRWSEPAMFFPPEGARFVGAGLQRERDRIDHLCRGCPVQFECLAGALLRGETYGSWGGMAQPDYQMVQRLWRDRRARGTVPANGRERVEGPHRRPSPEVTDEQGVPVDSDVTQPARTIHLEVGGGS